MRILFDANVLISAGLFPDGKVANIVKYATSKYKIVLTNTIIDEVERVVCGKFAINVGAVERLLGNLTYELIYIPQETIDISKISIKDPKDKHVLVSAICSSADVLITGDKHFFERKYEEIEILTPADFLEKY
jgi:putative PIN family toxin of toxin-antitoxin system